MTSFDDSHWSDSRFAKEYRDQADGYVPERRKLIETAQSLYRYFVRSACPHRMLDLGCGDGLMVQELLKVDDSIEATLVDGSPTMLEAAGKRLTHFDRTHFVKASFQDLLMQDPLKDTFCFVVSSLAIHHLVMEQKEALFKYIHHHLDPGGLFLNIDVVLSPTEDLENYYLTLWQEWIEAHAADSKKTTLLPVPKQYKDNSDNTPDPLLPQLQALENVGFKNVDCYYKYGIFAMFGGTK
jgi:tRNA (cmo5U34)-methyltransferase